MWDNDTRYLGAESGGFLLKNAKVWEVEGHFLDCYLFRGELDIFDKSAL